MSEAADELERMAEELEQGAVEMKETAGSLESLSSRLLARGEAVGFEASAKLLRERAAELRRSGCASWEPTPVQPTFALNVLRGKVTWDAQGERWTGTATGRAYDCRLATYAEVKADDPRWGDRVVLASLLRSVVSDEPVQNA